MVSANSATELVKLARVAKGVAMALSATLLRLVTGGLRRITHHSALHVLWQHGLYVVFASSQRTLAPIVFGTCGSLLQ